MALGSEGMKIAFDVIIIKSIEVYLLKLLLFLHIHEKTFKRKKVTHIYLR